MLQLRHRLIVWITAVFVSVMFAYLSFDMFVKLSLSMQDDASATPPIKRPVPRT